MTFWKRNRHSDDDAELDARMAESRAAFITHYNATFDFESGLDRVYSQAGIDRQQRHRQVKVPDSPDAGTDTERGLLQEICNHIIMIDAVIASIASSDLGPVVTATYLTVSRQFLLQLRTGLQARRLTLWAALSLISNVDHNLTEIDSVLRRHHGLSLDEALHDWIAELMQIGTDITEQMARLEANVKRLFDTADEAAELIPVH